MDTVLRFAYPKPEEIRTFRAYKHLDGADGATELELYEASAYSWNGLLSIADLFQVLPFNIWPVIWCDHFFAKELGHVCYGACWRDILDIELQCNCTLWHI